MKLPTLFKKKHGSNASDNKPASNYPKEIQEIHRSFETAADILLLEAQKILKDCSKKDVDKAGRLEKLGFNQVPQVVELKEEKRKAELSKEQIELIQYYKRNYPLNKFITENQVEEICKKWNLVLGDTTRYRGFVPEKNLKQIEQFKLKQQDANVVFCYDVVQYSGKKCKDFYVNGIVKESRGITSLFYHIYKPDSENYSFQSNDGENFYSEDRYNYFGKAELGDIRFKIQTSNSLKICAPIKDMDMTGMTVSRGFRITKIHVPDPVVLQPVKGGFLILTAWGDEASDPIVVNDINN